MSELANKIDSKFSLVVAAAKRAKQLNEGALPLVECDSTHPITIALYEIAAGKISISELMATPEPEQKPEKKRRRS